MEVHSSAAVAPPPRARAALPSAPAVSAARVRQTREQRFDPLKTITPAELSNQLGEYLAGGLRILHTWDVIESRDDMVRTVSAKRYDAVGRMRWEIQIDEDARDGQSAEAARHQEALQSFYSALECCDLLNQDDHGGASHFARRIVRARAHGLAAFNAVWSPPRAGRDLAAKFYALPGWYFEARSGHHRLLTDDYQLHGIEPDPQAFFIAASHAIMEAVCVAWIVKKLPLQDWLSFAEKFGTPGLIGKTDAPKDSEEWEALAGALAAFNRDWALIINTSASIDTIEAENVGANLPFPPLIERMDRMIAALWRGADLSTISAGQGQGQGASLQGAETAILEEDDARFVSEFCQRRIDRMVLRYYFGEAEPLAYFKLSAPVRQNVELDLLIDDFLFRHGLAQDRESVYARYQRPVPTGADVVGITAADPASELLNARADLDARDRLRRAAGVELAAARRADFAPVEERLRQIAALPENERAGALIALQNELPAMLRRANAAPESARAIERLLAASLANGFAKSTTAV